MIKGDFWNGGFGLGAELGAVPGLVIALVAMSLIRRRTKGAPFAKYGRSVWKLVIALTLVIAAMGGAFGWFLNSRYAASSSIFQMMELTGFVVGFSVASNSIIFVLMMIESIGELRRQFSTRGKPRQRLL